MEKSNKKIVIRLKIIYFLAKSTLLHITIISSINQYYKNIKMNLINNSSLHFFITIIIALTALTHTQPTNQAPITTSLTIDRPSSVSLTARQTYQYIINLKEANGTIEGKDFFFIVQWPFNDPFQNPSVELFVNGVSFGKCYNSQDEFSGICSVPSTKLPNNGTIKAEVQCATDCQLILKASFSERLRLALKDQVTFFSPQNETLPLQIQLEIPSSLQYTQIAIYAKIKNIDKALMGIQLYANIPSSNTTFPTKISYSQRGESIFWGGKGLFFDKQEVHPGDVIKVLLQISRGMQVQFSSISIKGNEYTIQLNKAYFDFTTKSEAKLYIMNVERYNLDSSNKTLEISLTAYAGNPSVSISLDESFKHVLHERSFTTTSIFLVTSALREQHLFNGSIFIKIRSFFPSDYLLITTLQETNYKSIVPNINYYNELGKDKVFNYFFDDLVDIKYSDIKSYSIRIDVIEGSCQFAIRRCESLEKNSQISKCLMTNASFLQNQTTAQSFNHINITTKKVEDYYYLYFEYNASQCTLQANAAFYYCSFQIIAVNPFNLSASFTLNLNKRRYSAILKEGTLIRDFVFKQQYLYYAFAMSSIEDVVEVTFYTTILEGDIIKIASSSQKYPTIESNQTNIRYTTDNHITFAKNQLNNTFYFAVYGLEISEFTLGVIVKRRQAINKTQGSPNSTVDSNATNSSKIEISRLKLSLGVSQQFSLDNGQKAVIFEIQAKEDMQMTIDVVALIGDIKIGIFNNNQSVACLNQVQQSNKKSCDLSAKAKSTYSVKIDALRGATQRFIIVYYKKDSCTPFPLNFPLTLQIQANQSLCAKFQIIKPSDLEIVTSLPLQYLISHSLKTEVCINKNCLQPMKSHRMKITKNELSLGCNFTNQSNEVKSCQIQLSFTSATSFINFNLIVEQSSKDIALLDGIVQNIVEQNLTTTSGKYLYYKIFSQSTIKLFISSLSTKNHYIGIKVVQESIFIKNGSDIYIPYRIVDQDLNQNFNNNYYETILYGIDGKMLRINNNTFSKYCLSCILTISIYPLSENSREISYLNLQISQDETYLKLGDYKKGYIEKYEVYVYQLDVNTQNNSIIHIKDADKQSQIEKECFQASIGNNYDQFNLVIEDGGMFYIDASKTGEFYSTNLFIKGRKDVCNYEISYTTVDAPLLSVPPNKKVSVMSHMTQKYHDTYLIYQHKSNESFKIVKYIKSGSISMFAIPIKSQTIKQYQAYQESKYNYSNNPEDDTFIISNETSSFCSTCSYLIKIKGEGDFDIEVQITNLGNPIPLSIHGILKQKLSKGNNTKNYYSFNSITSFNITINLLYGSLKILIKDPSQEYIYNSTITNSSEIVIPHNNQTEYFNYDYVSYVTRYEIVVQAEEDSRYSIHAEKMTITSRLFQGIPSYMYFTALEVQIYEFLNLNHPSLDQHSLNILISFVNTSPTDKIQLSIKVIYQSSEGMAPHELFNISVVSSQNTYNIEIPQRKGVYYIQIISNINVSAYILLVKQSLMHLKPQSYALMNQQNIFQLYSRDASVMIEVFTCQGDLAIDSSSTYSDLLSKDKGYDQIILEQSNYGGHFVLSVQDIYGEYYIKVNNKNPKAKINYLINYYYYSSTDILPYKLLDLQSREITYELTQNNIIFQLSGISLKDDSKFMIDMEIDYILYVSENKRKITEYINCRTGDKVFSKHINSKNISSDQQKITFQLKYDEIDTIIPKNRIYYISSEAVVNIKLPKQAVKASYPSNLRFIYDTVELSKIRDNSIIVEKASKYSIKAIILWIFMPVAIAGLLLYFAVKYVIRKYRGLLPNELMEQDDKYGSSNDVIKSAIPEDSPFGKSETHNIQSLKQEIQ